MNEVESLTPDPPDATNAPPLPALTTDPIVEACDMLSQLETEAPATPAEAVDPQWLRGQCRAAGLPRATVQWIEKQPAGWTNEWATWLAAEFAAGHCLVALFGDNGLGKTVAACLIARTELSARRTVRYITADDLYDLLDEARHAEGGDDAEFPSVASAKRCFRRYDLLIVDELQAGRDTEAAQRALHSIVVGRTDDARRTILLSNHTPENLARTLGNSMLDRSVRREVVGKSYRETA